MKKKKGAKKLLLAVEKVRDLDKAAGGTLTPIPCSGTVGICLISNPPPQSIGSIPTSCGGGTHGGVSL